MENKNDTESFDNVVIDLINKRTLSHHPELIEKLFEKYSLSDYLALFIKYNAVYQNDTYHNNVHSYSVSLNCYEGAIVQQADNGQIRSLLVGGLFHDFHHSQGDNNDEDNIATAIKLFKIVHQLVSKEQKLSSVELTNTLGAIKCTQYPYVVNSPKEFCKQIIRDADLMMVYELNPVRLELYKGLHLEVNKKHDMDIKEFCSKQQTFGSSIKWLTHWATFKAVMLNYPKKNRELVYELTA